MLFFKRKLHSTWFNNNNLKKTFLNFFPLKTLKVQKLLKFIVKKLTCLWQIELYKLMKKRVEKNKTRERAINTELLKHNISMTE